MRVLIASDDAVIAALVAAWAQFEGIEPVFHGRGTGLASTLVEQPIDACAADIDFPGATSCAFLEAARAAGVPVVLFSPARTAPEVRELAERLGCPWFPMPIGRRQFAETLRAAVAALSVHPIPPLPSSRRRDLQGS